MPSTAPSVAQDTPAFVALCARLAAALRAQADPQFMLQHALAQLRPADVPAWLEHARAFSTIGASALAMALLDEALRRWPGNPDLAVAKGNALRPTRRAPEAEAIFRNVLDAHPDHQQAAISLAFVLRDGGRIDAACKLMLDVWQRQGKGVEATLKAGAFLEECRRPQLAAQVYAGALADGLQDPRILASAGDVAMALGQFERGRAQLLAALDAGLALQDWSGIFTRLASAQHYTDSDHPDFVRFETAWDDPALAGEARIAAGFALGKARVDAGDVAGAVDVLRQANAMHRRGRPWDAATFRDSVATRIALPPSPQLDPIAGFESVLPVFVVGLPRTGTTLVENMLARHPQVRARGEMDWLPFLAFELSARQRTNDPVALRQAASLYLSQLRQDDAPAHWYIDKNPHNFRYLGLIASLFPQARIIHCVRERRDTAVSIWSQLFAHRDMDYAYDMSDIAAFAQGHDRLMAHWHATLQLPVFELAYERLVERPADMLRQAGEFLGLTAHDLLDSRPDASSAIGTASVWQARQPIHRGAVGRWREFAPWLPELTDHFGAD
jgi:tetratricopeptide (TPR) repeat protein